MHGVIVVCASIAAVTLVAAALHDLAVRTVPNPMIAVVGACGFALALLQHRLLISLAACAILVLVALALWLRGLFGGADAKLLAVSALLVAPAGIATLLLFTALAGGLLCTPYLIAPRLLSRPAVARPGSLIARLLRCERWRLRRRGPLPYAVAIAAGALAALLPTLSIGV